MFSRFKYSFLVFSICTFFVRPVSASVTIEIGPFDFYFGGGVTVEDQSMVIHPICQAMRERDLIEIFVEIQEETNKNEWKRLVVEPYILGHNSKGELILKGYHVESFVIPDFVSKKDEKIEGSGFVSGIYTIFKTPKEMRHFNIKRIDTIRVLEDTDFQVRKEIPLKNGSRNGVISKIICEVK